MVRYCNYHTKALRHSCPFMNKDMLNTIACSRTNSRLDYCNVVLYGVAEYNIHCVQRAQNRVRVTCRGPYRSVTNLLKELHGLSVHPRIQFKIAITTQSLAQSTTQVPPQLHHRLHTCMLSLIVGNKMQFHHLAQCG